MNRSTIILEFLAAAVFHTSKHNGYYCLTPDGKVIVSRHVIFDEQRFLSASLLVTATSSSIQGVTFVPIVAVSSSLTSVPDHQSFLVLLSSLGPDLASVDNGQSDSGSTSSDLQVRVDTEAIKPPSSSSVSPPNPVNPPTNTHAMVTRSKAEFFKPKIFTAEAVDFKPCSIMEALVQPE
ncbi:Retrovirus-related Pol polyprotein from transposon TNT 1-94 [Gossypium australe]|uniref:Retrovirus-related Pol polyprotein from transposon TNT 1-94 n=1 Tax=Gossypium australe TaxID=47621 RepID=A0A5B6WHR7_9ROSI|nr:Retrovirus-related Pol polyprotein from transposon TNT 1-94 [Gossypium australe]